jgi:Bacterial PH domain
MRETFQIIPGSMSILWILAPFGLIVLGASGLLIYSLAGARTARFEVSEEGLRLRGDLYGRLIPAADLHGQEARQVDLRRERELAPVLRTLGTAVPGYRAGWFRLRNREKALLYVTDPSRVVYLPTRAGYVVLVSVADPAAFIASVRRIAPKP